MDIEMSRIRFINFPRASCNLKGRLEYSMQPMINVRRAFINFPSKLFISRAINAPLLRVGILITFFLVSCCPGTRSPGEFRRQIFVHQPRDAIRDGWTEIEGKLRGIAFTNWDREMLPASRRPGGEDDSLSRGARTRERKLVDNLIYLHRYAEHRAIKERNSSGNSAPNWEEFQWLSIAYDCKLNCRVDRWGKLEILIIAYYFNEEVEFYDSVYAALESQPRRNLLIVLQATSGCNRAIRSRNESARLPPPPRGFLAP